MKRTTQWLWLVGAGACLALSAVVAGWWLPSVTVLISLGLLVAQAVALLLPVWHSRESALDEAPVPSARGRDPRG